MKTFLTFCILCTFQAFAQSGGMQVRLTNASDNCYWSNQKVYCHQIITEERTQQYLLVDSAFTDEFGLVKFNKLKAGRYQLTIVGDGSDWVVTDISVQDKQLFISQAALTSSNARSIAQSNIGTYVEGHDERNVVTEGQTITMKDAKNLPTRSSSGAASTAGNLQEVVITSYRVPLIQQTGVSSYTISRESVSYMNTQSSPIAWGETYLNTESINSVNVRGARTDGNSYYVDGVRVRGIDVPKSMIGTTYIITGGIPANYGDVTGGVISVTTGNTSRAYGAEPVSTYSSRRETEIDEDDFKVQFDRFAPIYENQFLASRQNAHSTFGLDVDRASWAYSKRVIEEGGYLSRDAVKVEEFINSFSHKKMNVSDEDLLNVEMERMACPWNENHQLLAVHLKASELKKEVDKIHHQYTFLIDVSGSMSGPDRLGLVQQGLINLVQHLDERDRVAIVTYAGNESVALYPTNGDQKDVIIRAIQSLGAGGSTNGSGGLKMAYDLANEMFDPQANNRVILATDGDFNVGISNPKELENYITTQRGKGIYLTALGVGMGNYRNDILETLADKGDGNHFYIRNAVDADKVLVKDLGNLITVARDVKLDVQFNPELVKEYRLLGYENRLMPSEDFKDDTKDGGEVGIGHQVVALYEIELGSDTSSVNSTDTLVYKTDDIAAVLLRYKPRKENASIERSFHAGAQTELTENPSLVLSAALALELRNSPFKGSCSMVLIDELAQKVKGKQYEELLNVCSRLVGL